MRKKTIEGSFVKRSNVIYSSQRRRVDGKLNGYAARVSFLEGNQPFFVNDDGQDICVVADGYTWLVYLPDGENWCMTAMYDERNQIIEWYFDITRRNYVDENGDPCLDDLFLDIVLFPNGRMVTLDEDELSEALNRGEITREDYQLAYEVHSKLVNEILDVRSATQLCSQLPR